nr:PAS domain-containing sensor histidine kinase [Desulfuromonadales bacterium]
RIGIDSWNDRVEIDVKDDGPGIDAENLGNVFEPLFSTKTTGIGLGLALSRRYAELNQGSLVAMAA